MKRVKAYEVRDDYEGHCCIEFATNNAAARRQGADELNTDWESIEHCRRKPEFDHYAPGPVPKEVLIDHGWWFGCHECERRVSNELKQEMDDEGLDPEDFDVVLEGNSVFCSPSCSDQHWLKGRRRSAAYAAFVEAVEARFQGCAITHIHIYGDKLETGHHRGGNQYYDALCLATFTFPGGTCPVQWAFGATTVWISPEDLAAFRVLYPEPEEAP